MPPQGSKKDSQGDKSKSTTSSSPSGNVFGDVAVRRGNAAAGNSRNAVTPVGKGGLFWLLGQGGNLIDRLNSGVGNAIDRGFDNTLGELIYNASGQSVDPRKWLSGDTIATGLDIVEDLALLAGGVPGAIAAGGKALLQNGNTLAEAAMGQDLETGEELSAKQKALKLGTGLGNVALMAAPGFGKLAGKGAAKAIAEADRAKRVAEIAERTVPEITANESKANALREMNKKIASGGLQPGQYDVALNEEAIKNAEKYGADYLKTVDEFKGPYTSARKVFSSKAKKAGKSTPEAMFSKGTTDIIDKFSAGDIARDDAINLLRGQRAALETASGVRKDVKPRLKEEINNAIKYLEDETRVSKELGDRTAFKDARRRMGSELNSNMPAGSNVTDKEVMQAIARENAASEFEAANDVLRAEGAYNDALFNIVDGLGNTTLGGERSNLIGRLFGGYGTRQGMSMRDRVSDFADAAKKNPKEIPYRLTKRGREEGALKRAGIENDADMINSIIEKVQSGKKLAPAEERYLEAVEMGRRESSNELADLLHNKIVSGKMIEGDEALEGFAKALENAKTVTKEGAEEGLASKGSKLGKTGILKSAGLAKVPMNAAANLGNAYANYAAENGEESNIFDMLARDPQATAQLALASLIGPLGGNKLYGKLGGTSFTGYRTGALPYSAARLTANGSAAVPRMVAASEAGRAQQAKQEMEDDQGRTRPGLRQALQSILQGDVPSYYRNYFAD